MRLFQYLPSVVMAYNREAKTKIRSWMMIRSQPMTTQYPLLKWPQKVLLVRRLHSLAHLFSSELQLELRLKMYLCFNTHDTKGDSALGTG